MKIIKTLTIIALVAIAFVAGLIYNELGRTEETTIPMPERHEEYEELVRGQCDGRNYKLTHDNGSIGGPAQGVLDRAKDKGIF